MPKYNRNRTSWIDRAAAKATLCLMAYTAISLAIILVEGLAR